MKWSMFLVHITLSKSVVIYNTINDGMIELPMDEFESLSFLTANNQPIDIRYYDDYEYLVENEYIINEDIDEKEVYLNRLREDYDKLDFLPITILTTSDCNFSCPYCYEHGIDRSLYLSKDRCKKIIEFIDLLLTKNKIINKSCLNLYGGEPLLNMEAIYYLLPEVDQVFSKHSVKYALSIVTNGYLLNSNICLFLKNYNWDTLQITLDGPEEVHNKRRNISKGIDSFGTIIKNIDFIIKNNILERINIRINIDKENIEEIPFLLKFLAQRYDLNRIDLSLGLITSTLSTVGNSNWINEVKIDKDIDSYVSIYLLARKLGFQMFEFYMNDSLCTAKMKHSAVIYPNGDIYKCESFVGRKEFSLGNIETENNINVSYLNFSLYDKCFENNCPLIPACNCGCSFQAYIKNGTLASHSCEYDKVMKINEKIQKAIHNE